jgi:deoxyribonuclease-1-like protein
MQLNKRFLTLGGLGIAFAYVGTHYRISGLDQLSLQPRGSGSSQFSSNYSDWDNDHYSSGGPANANLSRPQYPGRAGTGVGANTTAFDNLPPWEPKLSAGEKLAVMEERLSGKLQQLSPASNPLSSNSSFPAQLPVPLPSELEQARPSTGRSLPEVNTNRVVNRFTTPAETGGLVESSDAADRNFPKVRVASWNLESFGSEKLSNPLIVDVLISVISQFDVIALQGIQSQRDDVLPGLIDALNRRGAAFDYLVGPRVGKGQLLQQYAFVFNTKSIETDRYQLYTVEDPEDLMVYEPLVAWFRCKAVGSKEAFTFSLVNIRIHPGTASSEQSLLPNLIHSVVNDGRREDDIIAVGDFAGDPSRFQSLHTDAVRFAGAGAATEVSGKSTRSGVFFSSQATCEFTGRTGVIDFLRKFNLSLEKALEVSPQLPVWAEFYATEGSQPGRLAPGPNHGQRS